MKPFLIEGLDCSGKKAIAGLVVERLRQDGIDARLTIGPLVGGLLRPVDAFLANRRRSFPRESAFARTRRAIYLWEHALDQSLYRPIPNRLDVKVSSHFRTWARAQVERDEAMQRHFARTSNLPTPYAGAVLLSTAFDERVRRHRRDVQMGRTHKDEQVRFAGGSAHFDAWNEALYSLMSRQLQVVVIDTTTADVSEAAESVVEVVRSVSPR